MSDTDLDRRRYQILHQGAYTPASEPEDIPHNIDLPRLRHVLSVIGAVLIVTICVVTIVGLIPLNLIARATAWTE